MEKEVPPKCNLGSNQEKKGIWVAQSVRRPTLDFGLGPDITVGL